MLTNNRAFSFLTKNDSNIKHFACCTSLFPCSFVTEIERTFVKFQQSWKHSKWWIFSVQLLPKPQRALTTVYTAKKAMRMVTAHWISADGTPMYRLLFPLHEGSPNSGSVNRYFIHEIPCFRIRTYRAIYEGNRQRKGSLELCGLQ